MSVEKFYLFRNIALDNYNQVYLTRLAKGLTNRTFLHEQSRGLNNRGLLRAKPPRVC